MTTKFDALKAAVAAETTVVSAAVALLSGLGQRIRDALGSDDSEALKALADEIDANRVALARAVAENTGIPGAQSAAVSGSLPEQSAAVTAHPLNGGTGTGPLDNAEPVDPEPKAEPAAAAEG